MKLLCSSLPGVLIGLFIGLLFTMTIFAHPTENEEPRTNVGLPSTVEPKIGANVRVTVEVARDRAKVMHDIYTVTLDVIHRRYFHGEKVTIPARAMEDVFSEIKRQSQVDARWISVNLPAMSIDHEPKSDFEQKAAREISTGITEFELIEAGYFRRAGAIRLTSGCIGCHGGLFKEQSKVPRYAALVISIPVNGSADQTD